MTNDPKKKPIDLSEVLPAANDEQVYQEIDFSDPPDILAPGIDEDRGPDLSGGRRTLHDRAEREGLRDSGGVDPCRPIGRGNPPRSGQWQSGQSGNAGGRKKLPQSFADLAAKVFNRPVTIGGGETVLLAEALVLAVSNHALKTGHPSAFRALLPLLNQMKQVGEREPTYSEVMDELADTMTDDERTKLREMLDDLQPYLEGSGGDDEKD